MSPTPIAPIAPIAPPPLSPGATIALIAPASSPKPEALSAAIATLEAKGYSTKQYRPLTEPTGYLSGSDETRAKELMRAFGDPEVDAIFAVRGGYGVARMLSLLDFTAIHESPKILAGYSDLTALHVALDKLAGLISFHSPNAIDTSDFDLLSSDAFWQAVTTPAKARSLLTTDALNSLESITPGAAEGRLIGGNLAVFTSLIGGPFEPDTTGRILFLEDLDEAPYRIDRMLQQLKQAGKLDPLAGVLLGHFTDCESSSNDSPSPSAQQVLEEYFRPLKVPMLRGFPAGHESPNVTLPHGAKVHLDASSPAVRVL